jgi:hypothetical protein
MVQLEWQHAWQRLRWRRRGAWQWPAFVLLTGVDAVVLALLPFYAGGPDGFYPALLVSVFFNLVAVAIGAPIAGAVVRRARPDLPRLVARDYAGTTLLVALAVFLVAGGVAHRPAAAADSAQRRAVLAGVQRYVDAEAPELHARVGLTDIAQLEPRLYRACVPRPRSLRWLCLFVSTDQQPAGLTRDHDERSNAQQELLNDGR